MKNKKKRTKIKLIFSFLLLVIIGTVYLYNDYTIESFPYNKTRSGDYLLLDDLKSTLPQKLKGENFFKIEKDFEVNYIFHVEDGVEYIDEINEESISLLPKKDVTLEIYTAGEKTIFKTKIQYTDEEYKYYSSFYDIDYSEILKYRNKYVEYDKKFKDIFPSKVLGTNPFGKEKEYDVTYAVESGPINDKTIFEVFNNNSPNLYDDRVNVNFFTENNEPQQMEFKVHFTNLYIEPIVINKPFEKEDYEINVSTEDGKLIFKLDFPYEVDDLGELLENDKSHLVLNLNKVNSYRVTLINGKYVDIKEDEMFSYVAPNSKSLGRLEKAVKDAFDTLPLKLKEYAIFAGLEIKGEDFNNGDVALESKAFSEKYGEEDNIDDYLSILAHYNNINTEIVFNTNHRSSLMSKELDFSGSDYFYYNLSGYKKELYGTNKYFIRNNNDFYNYIDMKARATFYHEFIHFLDSKAVNNSDNYYSSIIDEYLEELRPIIYEIGYGYKNNFSSEFVAYAAMPYFKHPHYLKDKAPILYDTIEEIINNIDYSIIYNFNELVEKNK